MPRPHFLLGFRPNTCADEHANKTTETALKRGGSFAWRRVCGPCGGGKEAAHEKLLNGQVGLGPETSVANRLLLAGAVSAL